MKIRRIELYNFRQYKGKQVIDFSCDDIKNVTVLVGENTSGKTTFIRAFEWCLYDNLAWQDTPTRWKDDNLLNLEVASKMIVNNVEKVSVMLEILDDNGNEYQIKRTQDYVCNSNKITSKPSRVEVWKKNEIGEFKLTPIKDNDATIRDFLPLDFAKFFFFGGERLATITDDTKLSKYIKTLTGLSNLEKANVYLEDIIKTFKRKIHKNPNAEQYEKEKENLQSEINSSNSQLDNAIEQFKYYEDEVNKLNQTLKDNQKTKQKQQEREDLHNDLAQKQLELQNAKKDFIKYFNNNASTYFVQPLINQVEGILKNYQDSKLQEKENLPKNDIPYISKDVFKYIMQNKVCLCGANLEENPKSLEHLKELMEKRNYKPPVDKLEKSVNTYQNYIQSKHINCFNNFKLQYANILGINKRIDEIEDELSNIKNFLQSVKDLKKVEENLEQKSKQKKEWDTKKYNLQRKIDNNKDKIEELENKIALSIENTEFNKKQQTYIAYAQDTKNWICESLDKRTIEVKTTLQDKINGTFQKMYHGNRQIQIGDGSDEYKVIYTGGYLEESDGLKAVKNFAFIVGLIELAKQKLSDTDTEDLQRHFPLVMDAPFSNVDEIHISNICDIIPTSASQVIISVMDKDWEVARKNLERYVGKSYTIIKSIGDDGRKKETVTTIKEAL